MEYKDERENDALYKKYKTLANFLGEVDTALETIKDREMIETLLIFAGFRKLECTNSVQIHGVPIDASLAPIIEYCYNHRIKTIACCSGLRSEHIYDEDHAGYIAFKDNPSTRDFVDEFWNSEWEPPKLSYTYFIPSIHIDFNPCILRELTKRIREVQDSSEC